MVEIIRNKWCEDLEDLLQCPICMNRPKDAIYQCMEGHHICKDCRIQLRVCPTCNGRWSMPRVRVAENLCSKLDDIKLSLLDPEDEINKLLIPNRVSVGSQTDEIVAAAAAAPAPAVDEPTGAYPCCIGNCGMNLFFGPLMKHIKSEHSGQYLELPPADSSAFQRYTWPIDYTEQMIFDRAFNVHGMGIFYLKLSSDLFGNFTGFVLMLHNGFVSKQYTYQLEISCRGEDACLTYTGEVCSCRTPSTVLKVKSLQASRTDMARFIGREKQIMCTVLLGKKPQTEESQQIMTNYKQRFNLGYRSDGAGIGRGRGRGTARGGRSAIESWRSNDGSIHRFHDSEGCLSEHDRSRDWTSESSSYEHQTSETLALPLRNDRNPFRRHGILDIVDPNTGLSVLYGKV